MPYAQHLQSLTPREAVTDALYRLVAGLDRNDASMFESALLEDISFEFRNGNERNVAVGLSDLNKQLFEFIGTMDTAHMISNVRVDIQDEADVASLTCYAQAQHCPPGGGGDPDGPKFMGVGEYLMELVKDEEHDLWKIKKWALSVIWSQGDASVMKRPASNIASSCFVE